MRAASWVLRVGQGSILDTVRSFENIQGIDQGYRLSGADDVPVEAVERQERVDPADGDMQMRQDTA